MAQTATARNDLILVDSAYESEGQYFLNIKLPLTHSETLNRDIYSWDALKRLPEVVEFNGRLYGRTGWNSDTGFAYYKADHNIAKGVR